MSQIVPTVTAYNLHDFREQMERVKNFASRIHIDLMDGVFTPTKSPDLDKLWLPEGVKCDIHIMFLHPERHLDRLVRLKPNLVIVHTESNCDFGNFRSILKENGIKMGVGLLQDTKVKEATDKISNCDHCLIFSGHLGYHGGVADLGQLDKVNQIDKIKPGIEIGWDGGITLDNVAKISRSGISVLNVGSAIQRNPHPKEAYRSMVRLAKG